MLSLLRIISGKIDVRLYEIQFVLGHFVSEFFRLGLGLIIREDLGGDDGGRNGQ